MKRSRITRKTPLQRGTKRLKRSKLRPVGSRRAKLKRTQFGGQADRCRELPCCACGSPAPSDPHHVVPRSRGGTDADTVPLCRKCHRRGHAIGWASFEREAGVDLESIAERIGRG